MADGQVEAATVAEQIYEARVRGKSAAWCAQHFNVTVDHVRTVVAESEEKNPAEIFSRA
jgi:hypothetical protein